MDFDSLQDDAQKPQAAPERSPSIAPTSFDEMEDDADKYGGVSGTAKSFALGALGGADPTGLSTQFLVRSGIMKPEDIKGYEEQSPIAHGVGVGAGVLGMIAAPEVGVLGAISAPVKAIAKAGSAVAGAAAPLTGAVGKVLGQAGAMALGSSVEGAAYGLGQAVHEDALGDPDALGEKLMGHIGTGALWGGGIGAFFGGVTGALEARAAKLLAGADKTAIDVAKENAPAYSGIADAPQTGAQATTFQDIADKVRAAKASGQSIDLPQKAVLDDAISRVAMDNPVHPLQLKSLESQSSRDMYNTYKEMPGKEGDALRDYEAVQKNELVEKTGKAISSLSPAEVPTPDAAEGGKRAIKAFTDQYQAEKKELGPIFNKLKTEKLGESGEILNGAVTAMTDAVPGVSKMFKVAGEDLSVLPYKTAWGIDKATYSAVKEAVESLKENPGDFESLANIRRGLDQHVDIMAQGQAPGQIRAIKASLMDFMQDAVQKASPDTQVRDAFKRWAVNEQERGVIEKTFGASVGSAEFGAVSKVKPEMIGDKIFANTAAVQAAKNILSPEKFNEVLANWLSEAKAAATDKGAFSSNKFGSFLKKNQDALRLAFKDNPGGLQGLNDLATIMRVLPDSASINPSGTAKTLLGMLKTIPHNITWEGVVASGFQKILGKAERQMQLSHLSDELAGKSAEVEGLSLIERTANKATRAINSGASSIFSDAPGAAKTAGVAITAQERRDGHDKASERLAELTASPEKLIDKMSADTAALSHVAPKTAEAVQSSMLRATQFLKAKLPQGPPKTPLGHTYKPSDAELAKWHKYFSAVDSPTDALHAVARGTIVPETMEALSVVYPKLLQEMQLTVTDKMTDAVSKKKLIPYRTKLALSMFLGSDMVPSLNAQSMLANQNTLATATAAKQAQEMGSVNGKSLGKMEGANRFMTASQKSAHREDA